jgi:hypothetical protein
MEAKKPKILLIGWELHLFKTMMQRELQELSETFDIVFVQYLTCALDQIAKARLQEQCPIQYLVFNRNTLATSQDRCKLVFQFAEAYCEKPIVAINMLFNDQDSDARNYAVSAYYCGINDWNLVKVIFDNAK